MSVTITARIFVRCIEQSAGHGYGRVAKASRTPRTSISVQRCLHGPLATPP